MKTRPLAMLLLLVPVAALAQGTMADYRRAAALQKRCEPLVVDSPDQPVWVEGTSPFWFRKSVNGGHAFVLVDAAVPMKRPAFDHDRLAAGIGAVTHTRVGAATLPFATFAFAADAGSISFVTDSVNWMAAMPEAPADQACSVPAGTACSKDGMRGGRDRAPV